MRPDTALIPGPESAPDALERRYPASSKTVREVARRFRVGEDKVRGWIARGELQAINTAATLCGKPRWVITPDALAAFEKSRTGGPLPKPQRRRRQHALVDFFPD
jgi:hypothetical protein